MMFGYGASPGPIEGLLPCPWDGDGQGRVLVRFMGVQVHVLPLFLQL